MTYHQSLLLIFAISVFENLTKRVTEILLRVISWHLPRLISYPTTLHQLHQRLNFTSCKFSTFYCCPTKGCIGLIPDKVVTVEAGSNSLCKYGTCEKCKTRVTLTNLSRRNQMFSIFDLKHQLESLLGNRSTVAGELDRGKYVFLISYIPTNNYFI